jgi:hypothetical protein
MTFFLSTSQLFGAEIQIQIHTSKIHGLLVWAQTVAGYPHRSETLKEHFESSRFKTARNQKLIQKFHDASRALEISYDFPGYPQSRKQSQDLEKIFMIQAGASSSIGELRSRTSGLIPGAQHQALIESLEQLLPIYQELVWDPHLPKLLEYKAKMTELFNRVDVPKMLDQAATFYRSEWPIEVPFVVSFYPIPGKNHGSGENLGHFQSVGILLGREDVVGTFGVIFHELCHALYNAQSPQTQYEFEKAFLGVPSESRLQAYHFINEGLATALGNGWAYSKADGNIDEQGWYNDPYIETYARALFPKVTDYVEKGKAWDLNFVRHAVKVFEEKLPTAHLEYQNLLTHINLYWNPPRDGSELRNSLRKYFRIQGISGHAPISAKQSIDALHKETQTHLVVLDGTDDLSWLPPAYEKYRMAILAELKKNQDFIFAVSSKSAPALIVFAAQKMSVDKFAERIHREKLIRLEAPVLNFE